MSMHDWIQITLPLGEFTTGGKINMVVSVGLVTLLFGWCVYRVLFGKPSAKRLHGMDIDTKDVERHKKE
jgi:hypothetical protein